MPFSSPSKSCNLEGRSRDIHSLSVLVLNEETVAELLGEGFKLFGLNLIVVRSVHLAEHAINEIVGDGQVDVVVFEEEGQEMTELFAVEETILVLIELGEVPNNLVVQVGGVVMECLKFHDDAF